MIGIKVTKDSNIVTKVVILNKEGKALLLTRSNYKKKNANELDLPGGHIHIGEKKKCGLFREVEEETGLKINKANFFKRKDNIFYYYCHLENIGKIKLSNEHTDHAFYDISDLKDDEKFQKIAIEVMERFYND